MCVYVGPTIIRLFSPRRARPPRWPPPEVSAGTLGVDVGRVECPCLGSGPRDYGIWSRGQDLARENTATEVPTRPPKTPKRVLRSLPPCLQLELNVDPFTFGAPQFTQRFQWGVPIPVLLRAKRYRLTTNNRLQSVPGDGPFPDANVNRPFPT